MQEGKIIIGTGRQAVETYYLLQDINGKDVIQGFAMDNPDPGKELLGKKVHDINEILERYSGEINKPSVIVAIGAIDINKRLVALFKGAGFDFFNAISRDIKAERQRYIGEGITIGAGCVLTYNISVGNYSLINIGCTISHDCTIGNHVNISPGSHLAGYVSIDDDVFVGTGATFIPHVKIGKGSIIAAGACVTRDIPPYSMAAGVPAVVKKQIQP